MSNNLFPYRPIIKLKNRNTIYYRKDGNKFGRRKMNLLKNLGLLPKQFGVLIEVSFSIDDLSAFMMSPSQNHLMFYLEDDR